MEVLGKNYLVSACIRHSIILCGFNRTSIAEWRTGQKMTPSEIEKQGFMQVYGIGHRLVLCPKPVQTIDAAGFFEGVIF
ncbi:MAG: hypothetical protein II873_03925 [Oscillospiraceae bacterium]|nr:hypothetical protein [Oscillospiraceae bacterium]